MMKRQHLLLLLLLLAVPAAAQDSNFGIWTSIGADKKINKKLTVGIEGEFRSRNSSKTADRWSGEVHGSYKPVKWLKIAAAYKFISDNRREKITYNATGYNNWRPSYWTPKHRVSLSLAADKDFGRFNVSLRERWQYTYRPEKTTTRYDFDNAWWEETTVSSKAAHVLRSRLQVEYNIPKSKLTPYASGELFNGWTLQKYRITAGADYKLKKHHVIGAFYRYQHATDHADDAPANSHILGLSYCYKW